MIGEQIIPIPLKKDLIKKTSTEISILIGKKIDFFQDVIQKTILHVQNNKLFGILNVSDVNNCINNLCGLSKKIKGLNDISDTDAIINILQFVNNELSSLFKMYGTFSFEDLLWVCFGNNSANTYTSNEHDKNKFDILKK